MIRARSPLLSLFLSVLLTLTGISLASARGQLTEGDGQIMVFCSGGGLVQMEIGADGKPTGKSHLCPDIAASALAALDLPPVDTGRPSGKAEALVPAPQRDFTLPVAVQPSARGPPAIV